MRSFFKTISYAAMMVSAVTMFSSCEDELPEPQLKPRTVVTVQTDWSACGLESEPKAYYMSLNGEVSTISGNTNQMTLKSNNDYTFLLYSGQGNMTIDNGYATVEGAKYVTDDKNAINGNPETFCYGYASEASLAGDAKTITVAMKRATRKLNLELDYTGTGASLQGGYAILSNVYSVYNMLDGIATTPVTAVSSISFDEESHKIRIPFNLLGFNPEGEVLITLVLAQADGATQTISTKITPLVASFNDGNVADLNVHADLTLNDISYGITNWTVVNGGDLFPKEDK